MGEEEEQQVTQYLVMAASDLQKMNHPSVERTELLGKRAQVVLMQDITKQLKLHNTLLAQLIGALRTMPR